MPNQCTCTPGEPKPLPGETWRDLVDVSGLSDREARIVRRAAEAALVAGIEPGIRRARWIEGYVRGVRDTEIGARLDADDGPWGGELE